MELQLFFFFYSDQMALIWLQNMAGSRHGQGWAEPTQMSVLPTQSELDKDYVYLYVTFICAWIKTNLKRTVF